MFLLSIVPIHLSTDSDGIAANASNNVDVAEHSVMELEALYSSLILKQYSGIQVKGVDNSDVSLVKQELDKARTEELNLISTSWKISDNDTQKRLEYVKAMMEVVDKRILELQTLSQALTEGKTLDTLVDGVNNQSLSSVTIELNRVLEYKKELEASESH